MINQGVTAPDREAFEEWFNAFNIKEMPEYQTIRDFSFAAWQAATAAERERCAKVCDAIAHDWRGANSQSVQCAGAIRKGE
jgi:hypothetical protein